MFRAIDITGMKFNKLIAIKFVEKRGSNQYWEFLCDCGKKVIAQKSNVRDNRTKSCGCLRDYQHGMTGTRFHKKWKRMNTRCNNKNVKEYYRYGGRGIKICDRWLEFKNFKEDMYKSYLEHVEKFGEKNTTIERKNVNGNYELKNCCFATFKEQANNKRNNHLITYRGQTLNIRQWSVIAKISEDALSSRIKRGWSIEKTLTTKVRICKKNLKT